MILMCNVLTSSAPDGSSRTPVHRINNTETNNEFRESFGTRLSVCAEDNLWPAVGVSSARNPRAVFGFDVCN
jgi:hypothetical protein